MTRDELDAISHGTVDEVKPQLADLKPSELAKLRTIEVDGRNRVTLLEAIDGEIASRSGTRPAPDYSKLIQDQPRAYDNGKRAKASGIPLDQAPVFFNEAERDAWHLGYEAG